MFSYPPLAYLGPAEFPISTGWNKVNSSTDFENHKGESKAAKPRKDSHRVLHECAGLRIPKDLPLEVQAQLTDAEWP
jgi:hypothetical protein